jgi:hypothetical protein
MRVITAYAPLHVRSASLYRGGVARGRTSCSSDRSCASLVEGGNSSCLMGGYMCLLRVSPRLRAWPAGAARAGKAVGLAAMKLTRSQRCPSRAMSPGEESLWRDAGRGRLEE